MPTEVTYAHKMISMASQTAGILTTLPIAWSTGIFPLSPAAVAPVALVSGSQTQLSTPIASTSPENKMIAQRNPVLLLPSQSNRYRPAATNITAVRFLPPSSIPKYLPC